MPTFDDLCFGTYGLLTLDATWCYWVLHFRRFCGLQEPHPSKISLPDGFSPKLKWLNMQDLDEFVQLFNSSFAYR